MTFRPEHLKRACLLAAFLALAIPFATPIALAEGEDCPLPDGIPPEGCPRVDPNHIPPVYWDEHC